MELDKYVGIKHKFNGDTFGGADCIGLCRLFYKNHGWQETFTDGKPITKDWQQKEPYRLIRYLQSNFDMVKSASELEYGDIALFNYDGDYHLGIYIGHGQMLGMQVPCKEGFTISTIYKKLYWTHLFVRGYKRRKADGSRG